MSGGTRSQSRRVKPSSYSSSILFHKTATQRAELLNQFREHESLFIERKFTDETMEKVYLIVQFWMLNKNLSPGELATMLCSVDKKATFAAFKEGKWWRICKERTGARSCNWRMQRIVPGDKYLHLSTDIAGVTMDDSFIPKTIGLAAVSAGGTRISKWPFFGTDKVLMFGYDGTEFDKPLGPDDEAELRARLVEEGIAVPGNRNDNNHTSQAEPMPIPDSRTTVESTGESTDTTARPQERQADILDLFLVPQQPPILSTLTPPPPTPPRSRPPATPTVTEEPHPNADTEETQETHEVEQVVQGEGVVETQVSVEEVIQQPPTQATGNMEKDKTDVEAQKENTKGTRVKTNRFQKPEGLVPRILYGLRGKNL